jgi:single-strand DNA-binding protein
MTATTTIIGNITRDPELKMSSGGKPILRLGIAVSRRQQVDGVWQDGPTSFFDTVCFGNLAENSAASLTKGSRIIVTGRLEQRSYETTDGQKRSAVELVADEIGAALGRATVDIHRVQRDLAAPAPVADEEPF